MKVIDEKIFDFLGKEDRFFSIPIYQRNYDWKEKQCKKLLKDVTNIIDSTYEGKPNPGHFLGTIVFIEKENDNGTEEYLIIDGQQRLMTLIIMLKVIHDLIDKKDIELLSLKNTIYKNYLQTESYGNTRKMKLKPILADRDMYDKIMSHVITVDFSKKHDSRVVENYKIIRNAIKQKLNKYKLIDFYNAFKKLYVVSIKLDASRYCENPQLIFESLNSTGLSLTQGDLIRNFLLMRADPSKQETYYNEYWVEIEKNCQTNEILDEFLSTFTEMRTRQKAMKDNYYEVFKEKYLDDDVYIESIMADLKQSSLCYSYLIGHKIHSNSKINKYLDEFRDIDTSTTKTILLYLLIDHLEERITERELCQCFEVIISYILRRNICGKTTSSVRNTMLNALKNIEDNLDNPSITINEYYKGILSALCTANFESGFIIDPELKEALTMSPIRNKGYINYIFKKISNLSSGLNDNWDKFTIEHIMPQELTFDWQECLGKDYQNIHETYLDYIGNLTLVNNNSELSNKSFEDKKDFYKNSQFYLTKQICEYDIWNKKSIKERCEYLYELIRKIWKVPDEYSQIIASKHEIDCSKQLTFAKYIDVTGYKPHWVKFGDLDEECIKTWKDLYEQFLDYMCMEYEEEFNLLLEQNILGNVSKSNKNTKWVQLENGLFIPFSLSSSMIVKECSRIVNSLKIYDEIKFSLRRKDET